MIRLCAATVFAVASFSLAAPCQEPAPIDATRLEKANPALVTWSTDTKFSTYPPTVKLVSAAERASRVAVLEARNRGFRIMVDQTGRLVSFTSTKMPCALLDARLKDSVSNYLSADAIDPWFDQLAWALEQRNWDALGHARLPTKEQRSAVRVTFEREQTRQGLVVQFVLTFWSDPRPAPTAGQVLTMDALHALVKECQLEASGGTCAPCAPGIRCACHSFVRETRPCGSNLVFDVRAYELETKGVRRYLQLASAQVDVENLPRYPDATWRLVTPYLFDAVTGKNALTLWTGEGAPCPVSRPYDLIHGMMP